MYTKCQLESSANNNGPFSPSPSVAIGSHLGAHKEFICTLGGASVADIVVGIYFSALVRHLKVEVDKKKTS